MTRGCILALISMEQQQVGVPFETLMGSKGIPEVNECPNHWPCLTKYLLFVMAIYSVRNSVAMLRLVTLLGVLDFSSLGQIVLWVCTFSRYITAIPLLPSILCK
jgi:hypothetical protein